MPSGAAKLREARKALAYQAGYNDGISSSTHDPLGRGYRELSVSMAYTRGFHEAERDRVRLTPGTPK